jgi:very-short-patch-repair endonuclease
MIHPREVDLIVEEDLRNLKLGRVLPEYAFCPERKFRFDFAIPQIRLAVEICGGLFQTRDAFGRLQNLPGRHTHGAGQQKDYEKLNLALVHGWKVFQFSTADVRNGTARRFLKLWAEAHG